MTDKAKSLGELAQKQLPKEDKKPSSAPKEIGGRGGPDPVRYGDWEVGGKCVDF